MLLVRSQPKEEKTEKSEKNPRWTFTKAGEKARDGERVQLVKYIQGVGMVWKVYLTNIAGAVWG